MRLEGKVALISGGAHGVEGEMMGFGGASARLFVQEGAKVVLGDIAVEDGEKTASQLRDAGYDALFVKLDVTNEQDWENAVRTAVTNFGRLDIMVNNAGTGGPGNVEETTEDIWDGQMDVHAKGVFLGTKHAIPEMRKVGGGSIINISSIYGLVGSVGSTAYHAAKGAIRIFSKSAAVQYASENIRVNSVHPGFITTPLTREGLKNPEREQFMLDRIPMGRIGDPDEIAKGIVYLASDESSYMTGSELVIDGGMTAQ
ncbi:MAG: glucose 1-dehydrogenase [SAR202 cluster bacterium]|nr:glucose 1-dehydrogenase [SAR202 cluster bacterium]MDP6513471.1 glucose 1-dehydrogenase [SAR202 cluster bacterium]